MEDLPAALRLARLQGVWSVIEANMPGMFMVITETKVRLRSLVVS